MVTCSSPLQHIGECSWTKVHAECRSVRIGAMAARDRKAIDRCNNGHPVSTHQALAVTRRKTPTTTMSTTMAKDAARRGDVVEAENFYQHAEHYFRVMKEQNS